MYMESEDSMNVALCENGFVRCGDFYVQGMQRVFRPSKDTANDSRPSCTCPKGLTHPMSKWCEHKITAYQFLKTLH